MRSDVEETDEDSIGMYTDRHSACLAGPSFVSTACSAM